MLKLCKINGVVIQKNNILDEIPWIYETGYEEPEILGSGSRRYNISKTKNEEKAFRDVLSGNKNYLIRYKKCNDEVIICESYDFYSKRWFKN